MNARPRHVSNTLSPDVRLVVQPAWWDGAAQRPVAGVVVPAYAGHCVRCAREHIFHNDQTAALQALHQLLGKLEAAPAFQHVHDAMERTRGKMVGVLVALDRNGQEVVLHAFSGDLLGRPDWEGWVGSVMERAATATLEEETLQRLAPIEEQLKAIPLAARRRAFLEASGVDVGLDTPSVMYPRLLAARRAANDVPSLRAVMLELEEVELLAQSLKSQRRQLSATLMAAMFDAASLTNARGERVPMRQAFAGPGMPPSGTSECAAPKLLEAANRAGLRPMAMAEAWFGPSLNNRHPGDLQAPCLEKCRPILGHLLCGLEAP